MYSTGAEILGEGERYVNMVASTRIASSIQNLYSSLASMSGTYVTVDSMSLLSKRVESCLILIRDTFCPMEQGLADLLSRGVRL